VVAGRNGLQPTITKRIGKGTGRREKRGQRDNRNISTPWRWKMIAKGEMLAMGMLLIALAAFGAP
jgi:hypothetical protein